MPNCLIYRGRGVALFGIRELTRSLKACLPQGWTVQYVSAQELQDPTTFSNLDLLVFPGGRDVPYHEDLGGAPNHAIRQFVLEGGRYLGVCAGAYYGCASVVFEPNTDIEVIGPRDLAFFPGVGKGCVFNSGRFHYDSEEVAEASQIEVGNTLLDMYYNGGCSFDAPEVHKTVQVIGRYVDAPNKPAAIVQCSVGKGFALLCGPHIDYSPSRMLRSGLCKEKVRRLQAADCMRRQLFSELLLHLVAPNELGK